MGYAPPGSRNPPMWACDACIQAGIIQELYHMTDKALTLYEARALAAGGNDAGSYLDSIGKTDLATLEQTEWTFFLSTILKGYAEAMRVAVASGEAPF